jgi:hypothetical protein
LGTSPNHRAVTHRARTVFKTLIGLIGRYRRSPMPWHGAMIKPVSLYLSDQRVMAYQRAILCSHHLG